MYNFIKSLVILRNVQEFFISCRFHTYILNRNIPGAIYITGRSFLMLATLRQCNFALLWLGGLISLIGDWALMVGLPIYVYLLTRSVLALSIALLVSSLPNITLSSIGGALVDCWAPRRSMGHPNLLLALALLPPLVARTQ